MNYEAKEEQRAEKLDRLKADLRNMAVYGSLIFNTMHSKEIDVLLSQPPAYIRIAIQDNMAKMMFPAALIYDYPLDETYGKESVDFCPEFEAAFLNNRPLEDTPCFKGQCPTLKKYLQGSKKREDRRWVCPSGFWGFRHYLGMPLSAGKEKEDSTLPTIPVKDEMHISVAFAKNLSDWKAHCKALRNLFSAAAPRSEWNYAQNRDDLVDRVLKEDPHIVYFYCHGGEFRGGVAYLKVGPENNLGNFRPGDNDDEILWTSPRPLVFLNGCHTAEIDPDSAFDLIDPFIKKSKSAGVIGTNIIIFEPMAAVFAQDFFDQFVKGVPVGVAIRNARLKILDYGDPMGLVYILFVYAGLNLEKE